MTTDGDTPLPQPDDKEPIEQLFGDVFALVDEAVAQITDAEVNDQLRKALGQAGRSGRLTDLWQAHDTCQGTAFADLNGSIYAAAADIAAAQLDALQCPPLEQTEDLDRTTNGFSPAADRSASLISKAVVHKRLPKDLRKARIRISGARPGGDRPKSHANSARVTDTRNQRTASDELIDASRTTHQDVSQRGRHACNRDSGTGYRGITADRHTIPPSPQHIKMRLARFERSAGVIGSAAAVVAAIALAVVLAAFGPRFAVSSAGAGAGVARVTAPAQADAPISPMPKGNNEVTCTVPDSYFIFNTAELIDPGTAVRDLTPCIAALAAHATFALDGWTSYEGPLNADGKPEFNYAYNFTLSVARVQTIANLLVDYLGVPRSAITRMTGHGNVDQPNPDPRSPANRVVVITYTVTSPTPSSDPPK
jgi:hypothetical protein